MPITGSDPDYPSGTGEVGWDFVYRRIGYAGWIGCEYNPVGDTVARLAWRRRYGV